ncbi:MAG: hypothetical protein LBR19_07250, partial [Bifidobacteriaceae bacterium]|nr:hypothetical protein [Bifidobacteriaceae bacterium]
MSNDQEPNGVAPQGDTVGARPALPTWEKVAARLRGEEPAAEPAAEAEPVVVEAGPDAAAAEPEPAAGPSEADDPAATVVFQP